MQALKKKTTSLLLNWYANPYHTPIFVAKMLGFYEEENIQLSIFEPTDPNDVNDMIRREKVDFGLKPMLHTVAGRAKGFLLTSIATLLNEPSTGLLALKSSGIQSFQDIENKRVGYMGRLGKKIIDNLAQHVGIKITSYQTIRVGMNVTDAICRDVIDTGIGFVNFHKIELEHHCGEVNFLRLDQLVGLGCFCLCSIQYIASEKMMKQPEKIKAFLRATQRGAAFTIECPDEAFEILCQVKPLLRNDLYRTIFLRTLPFFSRSMFNVESEWEKVNRYMQHLNIVDDQFDIKTCYTNQYLPNIPYTDVMLHPHAGV